MESMRDGKGDRGRRLDLEIAFRRLVLKQPFSQIADAIYDGGRWPREWGDEWRAETCIAELVALEIAFDLFYHAATDGRAYHKELKRRFGLNFEEPTHRELLKELEADARATRVEEGAP